METFRKAICWVRRDLRLSDHVALARATRAAARVALTFVFDQRILGALQDRDDRRVTFLHRSLAELDARLREHGSRLVVLHGDPVEEIPRLAERLGAEAVFANHDDEPYSLCRDARVAEVLGARAMRTFKDHVIFERREVLSQSGEPLQVYKSYRRAWLARFTPQDATAHEPDLGRLWPADGLVGNELPSLTDIGFREGPMWLEPGESGARRRLETFLPKMPRYGEDRDFPALNATSGLSVHLRHGTVSIRECVRTATAQEGPGALKWLGELIWREFYHMILAIFPHVVQGAFKREFDAIDWPGSDDAYDAWAAGRTGYPIVDAAMRCLNRTGWMHNRLRMVCASFLVKDLLIDWRRGEAWFARQLLDFDLSQNNGGWQWAASTGVDAQPYFRIFNPVLQSRKFDPKAHFIREWTPELSGYGDAHTHWPHDSTRREQLAANCEIGRDYPAPIVDHLVQRNLAVRLLASAR